MEIFNTIYLIIPFLFYSLQAVIITKFSRLDGSIHASFYRQFTIFLVGLPLLFFFPIDLNILKENAVMIITTSIIGAFYLSIVFKSYDYIPVAIGNTFQLTSRILFTIIIGILFLSEHINFYQAIFIGVLIITIFSLLKVKEKFNITGITLSVISGGVFIINWYCFTKYSTYFQPIIAGYILEVVNGFFLLCALVSKSYITKKSLKQTFQIDRKSFGVIFASAPLVILAGGAIAQSYEIFTFTIVVITLTMMLPAYLVFSGLILKEKLSFKTIISILIITLSIMAIKFFE